MLRSNCFLIILKRHFLVDGSFTPSNGVFLNSYYYYSEYNINKNICILSKQGGMINEN